MIRPVGEIFEDNGAMLQVVKCESCIDCYFETKEMMCDSNVNIHGYCSDDFRKENIIFKELEQ